MPIARVLPTPRWVVGTLAFQEGPCREGGRAQNRQSVLWSRDKGLIPTTDETKLTRVCFLERKKIIEVTKLVCTNPKNLAKALFSLVR